MVSLKRSSFSLGNLRTKSKPNSSFPNLSVPNLTNSDPNIPDPNIPGPKAYMSESWYVFLKKKYDLNDEQMDEYVDSFEMINKGDAITIESFARFIGDADNDSWDLDDCKQVLAYVNKVTGNEPKKMIDLRTYMTYIIPVCNFHKVSIIEIRELFDNMDSDQDGNITCTQLTDLIYKINTKMTPEELSEYKKIIKGICTEIDVNDDGLISYDEFKNFILNHGFNKK